MDFSGFFRVLFRLLPHAFTVGKQIYKINLEVINEQANNNQTALITVI